VTSNPNNSIFSDNCHENLGYHFVLSNKTNEKCPHSTGVELVLFLSPIPTGLFLDSSHLCLVQSIHQTTGMEITGDKLIGPSYLNRDDHDHKIRARKQRTDIGKYSFVNRTIKLWNQLPAEVLVTFTY